MKIAVVGRPNTGKSTFINTLAHSERMIVSERPGTTRDSVDVRFELDGLPFMAIDTAGVKRKAKIKDDLEFYSIHRAERSIRRADVTFLLIDPTQGISPARQAACRLYRQAIQALHLRHQQVGPDRHRPHGADMRGAMTKLANGVQFAFRNMAYMPLAFITAKTGKNVKALLNLAQAMYKQANKRVGTSALNKVLREAVEAHPPSSRERTPRIYYATQVGVAPPTMVLFVNSPTLFDPTYQRYLLNVFREKLPYHDIPIKLYLRARSQTDPNAPRRDRDDSTDDIGSFLSSSSDEHEQYSALAHSPDNAEINDLMADLED